MRLRIVSDGTRFGTSVTVVETGEDISHLVTGITWAMEEGAPAATVTLTLYGAHVDAEIEGELDVPAELEGRIRDPQRAQG